MREATDQARQTRAYRRGMRLMGNHFEITVVTPNEDFANYCIDKAVGEIGRIEKLLTTFNDQSQTSMINMHAGIKPVEVNQEVFDLIARSNRISALTQGAFDLSYGSVDKAFWNFNTGMSQLPDRDAAKKSVRLINYRNIILNADNRTVFLKEKGMRIGFGGIGKGYAAERAKDVLLKLGIKSGIVNASGDLAAWGQQPGGTDWTVGVADPDHRDQPFSYLNISNLAIATSGNYEKYVMIGGKRYSHTIDPRTGFPVKGIKSVSIICPNAEIADAMATPVTVMGVCAGMNLINQMKDIACVIIDDNDRLYTSKNIKLSQ